MDDATPEIRRTHDEALAERWTRREGSRTRPVEEEIIYLQLPSPSVPSGTYVFPLAICPVTAKRSNG